MDGIPPEIPPMMDFETCERETELELAGKGQKANGADPWLDRMERRGPVASVPLSSHGKRWRGARP
jgi:hypothetical protein